MDWTKVYNIVKEQWCPEHDAAVNFMGTWMQVPFKYATHFSLLGAVLKVLTNADGLVHLKEVPPYWEWYEWSKTATHKDVLKSIRARIESDNYQLN